MLLDENHWAVRVGELVEETRGVGRVGFVGP